MLCTCSVLGIVVFLCMAFLCIPSPIFNLHDQKDSPTPASEGPTTPSECPSCRPCDPCLPCEAVDSTTQDRISFLECCCEYRHTAYTDCLVAPSPDSENFIDWAGTCCIYGSDCYVS